MGDELGRVRAAAAADRYVHVHTIDRGALDDGNPGLADVQQLADRPGLAQDRRQSVKLLVHEHLLAGREACMRGPAFKG